MPRRLKGQAGCDGRRHRHRSGGLLYQPGHAVHGGLFDDLLDGESHPGLVAEGGSKLSQQEGVPPEIEKVGGRGEGGLDTRVKDARPGFADSPTTENEI